MKNMVLFCKRLLTEQRLLTLINDREAVHESFIVRDVIKFAPCNCHRYNFLSSRHPPTVGAARLYFGSYERLARASLHRKWKATSLFVARLQTVWDSSIRGYTKDIEYPRVTNTRPDPVGRSKEFTYIL